MTDWHPDHEALERFLDDGLSEEESRALQRHLFTCASCEDRMIALLPGPKEDLPVEPWHKAGDEGRGTASDQEEPYKGLVQRVLEQTRNEIARRKSHLERERREAAELWSELAALSPAAALVRVEEPRFHNWGLYELLLQTARQTIFQDYGQAEEQLRLAVFIAGRLESRGPGSVEAAQARALTYLGNALRVRSDFRGADRAFQEAESVLARSWLDPLDEALLLEYKGALRRAQGRFEEALEMLDCAIGLYQEVNEPHRQGRSLITKGLVLQYAHSTEAAAGCFRNGLFLIHPPEEPRLVVVAHYGLIHCMNDSGRFAEAKSLIEEARPVWQGMGRRLDLVRLRWLEGKVVLGLGRPDEAEEAFLEVRAEFERRGIAYDAALVSLDLAWLYVRQGKTAETKRLAAEMLPIFQSRDVHREALAALIVFQQAAEMEQLTLSLVDEIATYLQSARRNPELRFRGTEAAAGRLVERGTPAADRRSAPSPLRERGPGGEGGGIKDAGGLPR
jgi:tetratricopeptide (TPR) repeat protein